MRGPVRRAAAGGEALQYPHHGDPPGAVATELPNSVTDPAAAERIKKFYAEVAVPADSFARAAACAMSQPDDVDISEILFRPTKQKL
jgi:NADP-dependent 3-hydroxy acid dehydrogenase YdfG